MLSLSLPLVYFSIVFLVAVAAVAAGGGVSFRKIGSMTIVFECETIIDMMNANVKDFTFIYRFSD